MTSLPVAWLCCTWVCMAAKWPRAIQEGSLRLSYYLPPHPPPLLPTLPPTPPPCPSPSPPKAQAVMAPHLAVQGLELPLQPVPIPLQRLVLAGLHVQLHARLLRLVKELVIRAHVRQPVGQLQGRHRREGYGGKSGVTVRRGGGLASGRSKAGGRLAPADRGGGEEGRGSSRMAVANGCYCRSSPRCSRS